MTRLKMAITMEYLFHWQSQGNTYSTLIVPSVCQYSRLNWGMWLNRKHPVVGLGTLSVSLCRKIVCVVEGGIVKCKRSSFLDSVYVIPDRVSFQYDFISVPH